MIFGVARGHQHATGHTLVKGLPVADEILKALSAADEIAQFWHAPALDLEGRRRQLLARAMAAGRPAGMRSWADDSPQDTGYSDFDRPQ